MFAEIRQFMVFFNEACFVVIQLYFPQSKDMQVRLTVDSKLPVGMNVSINCLLIIIDYMFVHQSPSVPTGGVIV